MHLARLICTCAFLAVTVLLVDPSAGGPGYPRENPLRALPDPTHAPPGPTAPVRGVHVPLPGPGAEMVPEQWMSQVTERIRRAEYQFTLREDGAWSAPNRVQGLRAVVSRSGFEVIPRSQNEEGSPAWRLALCLSGFGRQGALRPVRRVRPQASGHRAEFRRPGLSEWYLNQEKGLEQGFTIDEPPEAGDRARPLVLEMSLSGDLVPGASADGRVVSWRTRAGLEAVRYEGLQVFDAAGEQLEARLVLRPGHVQIQVEDQSATYPIHIDPLMTSPAWSTEADQTEAHLGIPVAPAGDVNGDGFGDVNGDGYDDVIVGADDFDAGETNEGQAWVFHGSPAVLGTSPAWSAESNQADSWFGWMVASAGDVNGDGFSDIIAGVPVYTNGQAQEGAAFVFLSEPVCLDGDGDGYGSPASPACPGGDLNACDDANPAVFPGNPEICDNHDNDCDGTVDDFQTATTCGVGECLAFGVCVAGLDTCTPGDPSPEACDGRDNNCDGIVDNPPPPAGSPSLTAAALEGGVMLLSWSALPDATGYDVVQGDLLMLSTSTGDFSLATSGCLAESQSETTVEDAATPAAAQGRWYLGGTNCGGNGTYNTGTGSEAAPRDAGIEASPGSCP